MTVLRLKEILKEKGVTGKEISSKIGSTETSLSRIIKGNQQPRFELLLQLADLLEVDMKDLFHSTKEGQLNGFVAYNETT
jgi:transcriptional regulator with XRE-family HTH domain